jgi:hypothetical protein
MLRRFFDGFVEFFSVAGESLCEVLFVIADAFSD